MHTVHDFLAPLRANYRAARSAPKAEHFAEVSRRLCNARRDDMPAGGAGSADSRSRSATTSPVPAAKAGDDDGGDGDSDGEAERRRHSRQNTIQTALSIKSRDQIETLIDVLVTALEQLKPKKLEETLWDVEQIAQWLGLSKITVEARVVTRPGFPAAFRPVDSKKAQRRWFASDVHEWARMHTGVIPTARLGRKRRTA